MRLFQAILIGFIACTLAASDPAVAPPPSTTPPITDPLAAPPQLIEFARKVARSEPTSQARLRKLIATLQEAPESGGLGMRYEASPTRTLAEAWRDRKANCLSLTAIYIACARAMDMNAQYAEVENSQRWRRVNNVIRFERHMVAVVRDGANGDLVADFLPQPRKRFGVYVVTILPESRVRALYHSNRAAELLEQGDKDGALLEAQASLDIDPTSSVGWNTRGVVLKTKGQHTEAETSYRKALKLNPRDISALGNMENLLLEQRRLREAAEIRRITMKLRRQDPFFHAFLAEESIGAGKLNEALDHITDALRLQKHEPEFQLLQAHIKVLQGKPEEAARDLEAALRQAQPGEREIYENALRILKETASTP